MARLQEQNTIGFNVKVRRRNRRDKYKLIKSGTTRRLGTHYHIAELPHDAPKDALSVLQLGDTVLQELSLSLRVGGL